MKLILERPLAFIDIEGTGLDTVKDRIVEISGKFVIDEKGKVVFNFGPHKGKDVHDEMGFVEWMTSKEFPPDTMDVCYKILAGGFMDTMAADNHDALPF